jgi:TDG/mug DNA glycosylase family protein
MAGDTPYVLIIGSFPSRQSLEKGEYYANRQNRFWTIMQALFGIDPALPYRQRTALLMREHVALWDAIGSCSRAGSADNRIKDPVLNDVAGLLVAHPSIRLIACNGGASARHAAQLRLPGNVPLIRLPSTSPAYAAMSLEEKIARWSVLRQAG